MNDLERWVHVRGPQPQGVRELFDAARRPPEVTPELKAELDARVYAAIAAHERSEALKRTPKRGAWAAISLCLLAVCLLSAGFAGAIAVASAIRATERRASGVAKERSGDLALHPRARQPPAPPPSGSAAEPEQGSPPPLRRP